MPRPAIICVAAALAALLADASCADLHAQGKLDARYTITLAGLPLGRGGWAIDIADDHFSASASGATTGLMQIIASGQGRSAARGSISGGHLIPSSYVSSIVTDKKYDEVRMAISGGNVREFSAEPPSTPAPDRVPLTEAHRHGVSDPMSASLMRVPGNAALLGPESCPRRLAIFDGRMRYDLHMSFKRLDNVHAERGYQGAAVVCAVRFAPIAGHIPDRAAIKYLTGLHTIEVWLAPIAGTRVLAPFRVAVPTPLGLGVMQATEFVSIAQPGKAAKAQ